MVLPHVKTLALQMEKQNLETLRRQRVVTRELAAVIRAIDQLERKTADAIADLVRYLPRELYAEWSTRFETIRTALKEATAPATGSTWAEGMTPEQFWVGIAGQYLDDDDLAAVLYPRIPREHALGRIRQMRRQAKKRKHPALNKRPATGSPRP
jgi:hypothetical protein